MKQNYGSISPFYGQHVAGICKIMIIPRHWLTEKWTTDFVTGKVNAIQGAVGASFLELKFLAETYKYSEKPKENKSGTYFEISITGTCNGIDEATWRTLMTYRYQQFVAVITDAKHRLKVVGNMDAGLLFEYTNAEVNEQGGIQKVDISLALQQEDPAPFWGETEPPVTIPKLNVPGSGSFRTEVSEPDSIKILWNTGTSNPSGITYILEVSKDPAFGTVITIDVFPTDITDGFLFYGPVDYNTVYYFRMKVVKANYLDSDWAESNISIADATLLPVDDLWLDLNSEVAVITTNDGTFDLVDKWTDQATGMEFISGDDKPCLVNSVLLGKPVISSHNNQNGVLSNMNVAEMLNDNSAGLTVYIVASQKILNDIYGVFIHCGNGVVIRRYYNTNSLYLRMRPGTQLVSSTELTDEVFYTIRCRFDGTNLHASINNGPEQSQPLPSTFWANGATEVLGIGSNKKLARALVYQRDHDETIRNQVESILRNYYSHY